MSPIPKRHLNTLDVLNTWLTGRRITRPLGVADNLTPREVDAAPLPVGFRRVDSRWARFLPDACPSDKHNPPHVMLPAGWYEYTCPWCGHVVRYRGGE